MTIDSAIIARAESGNAQVIGETQSVCPVCFQKIDAVRTRMGNDVFLEKTCPLHGEFSALIWKGPPEFTSWVRPKIPTTPPVCHTDIDRGCPYDCGLCADHRQRTCATLLEVTQRCNLNCPVCFAGSGTLNTPDPSFDDIRKWFRQVMETAGNCNIQLSGGEPTLREDLPDIVRMGREAGFSFIQLNTNGLRLGADPGYVKKLREAGLSSVFLQFDATSDAIYQRLRGRPLKDIKTKAISCCIENAIGVVLVPTIVAGINDHEIGDIVREAVRHAPGVRGVHFQPVSCFGRYPKEWAFSGRITLPEIMRSFETQTNGMIRISHFSPPGCENALCSFHGSFIAMPGGKVTPILSGSTGKCCGRVELAETGAFQSISTVARKWSASVRPAKLSHNIPVTTGKDTWPDFDSFITAGRERSFSISGMAFQDAWTLDLERLRDCCIHVFSPDGRLIPFCAYNLTDSAGQSLYRR